MSNKKRNIMNIKDRLLSSIINIVVEDERTIIKFAFQFWFADEDTPEGKVWIYMCAMHKYKE